MATVSSLLFGEYLDETICPSQSHPHIRVLAAAVCVITAEDESGK